MSNIKNLLATCIRENTDIVAIVNATNEYLKEVDTTALIPMLFSATNPKTLEYSINQFNLNGFNGAIFAQTENEQIELLTNAITLHRFKGTVFSLKQAFQKAGFPNITILEGTPISTQRDGRFLRDGTLTYNGIGGTFWANYSLEIENGGITPPLETIDFLRNLALSYAPARCFLVDITFI